MVSKIRGMSYIQRKEETLVVLVTSWVETAPIKHVIEGKREGRIGVKRRRGRRRKQLLDDFKEKRGNCKLKEKALDRAVWKKKLA